jgi:predicted nuclease with TOPRIM domain
MATEQNPKVVVKLELDSTKYMESLEKAKARLVESLQEVARTFIQSMTNVSCNTIPGSRCSVCGKTIPPGYVYVDNTGDYHCPECWRGSVTGKEVLEELHKQQPNHRCSDVSFEEEEKQAVVEDLRKRIAELEELNNTLSDEAVGWQDTSNTLEQCVSEFQENERPALQKQIADLQNEVQKLKAKVSCLREERDQYRVLFQQEEGTSKTLRGRWKDLKKKVAAFEEATDTRIIREDTT